MDVDVVHVYTLAHTTAAQLPEYINQQAMPNSFLKGWTFKI